MNVAVVEDSGFARLLPLTWLRATFELRLGRRTLIEKLRDEFGAIHALLTRPLLADVLAARQPTAPSQPNADWLVLNGRALLDAAGVVQLRPNAVWTLGDQFVAARVSAEKFAALRPETCLSASALLAWHAGLIAAAPPAGLNLVEYPWDLIALNGRELRRELRGGSQHGRVYAGAHLLNEPAIEIGAGAVVKPGVVLDAENGPICIDVDAQIQPNAVLEGPCYVGPRTIIRPGAVIRENSSIGPMCRVGGEIEGSIFQGFGNKQHDGFLGHSFVSSWVNLGADTITSDLKNTYGTVRVSLNGKSVESGQTFVGSFVGEHAKTGIGTILPTGCVIGAAANVFTRAPVPKFVPSFAWLTDAGLEDYRVEKAVEIARTVMGRRKLTLSEPEAELIMRVASEARDMESAGWK